jgi:hypothetical protein
MMRWEREYRWAEGTGAAKVYEQERPLAEVLAPMLTTPDMWNGFADAYLAELDRIATAEAPPPKKGRKTSRNVPDWQDSPYSERNRGRTSRTGNLAYWNSMLLEHLDEDQARRLAEHAAFYSPYADFFKAQAARRRGDLGEARTLIAKCLKQLPGKTEFKDFAEEVDADAPDLS